MNTKNITIGVFVATTIVLAVLAFKAPTVIQVPTKLDFDISRLGEQKAPVVNVPAPIVNVAAPNVNVNVPKQSQTFGSVTSPDITSPYVCANAGNFSNCKYTVSGNFADATTTLAIFTNPFNATSTIIFAEIEGSNSTSTIDILIGTTTLTTSQSLTNNNQVSASVLNVASVSTSTNFFAVNGINAVVGTNQNAAGASSQNKIVVGPNERIIVVATSTSASNNAVVNSALTNATNLFSGTFLVEFQN